MEKQRVVWCWTVLLLAGLNAALAQDTESYFVVGGKLDLRPPVSESINNLLWKHDGNLVAEWVKDKLDKVYGGFKGRTTMDKTTGRLEITNMTEADAGVYAVEINKRDQGLRYVAKAIKEVPKPSVVVRPLTCTAASDQCTLNCHGETGGAEPVDYSWKMGDGEWKQSEKDMVIKKTETSRVKTFTCQMKNPVSVKESEPHDNLFFQEDVPDPVGNGVGVPVGATLGVLAVVGLIAGGVWWKRDEIMKLIGRGGNGRINSAPESGQGLQDVTPNENTEATKGESNAAAGNGAKHPPETSAGNPETEPLNSEQPAGYENVSERQ